MPTPMHIDHFDDLLAAARAQPAPQRLLLVFVAASPGDDPTPEQRQAFEDGHGGELTPLMCVDKSPDEVESFAALAAEAREAGPPWVLLFAAALSGTPGVPLDARAAQAPLERMVESIHAGDVDRFIAFDTTGQAVALA